MAGDGLGGHDLHIVANAMLWPSQRCCDDDLLPAQRGQQGRVHKKTADGSDLARLWVE